jgi:hypothetical protein
MKLTTNFMLEIHQVSHNPTDVGPSTKLTKVYRVTVALTGLVRQY